MSITVEEKARLIKEYATKEGDTGSPEVQVAILSSRIATLTEHFKTHKKDNHSRRGLLMQVAQRRKLLDYLKSKDEARYTALIGDLSGGAPVVAEVKVTVWPELAVAVSVAAGGDVEGQGIGGGVRPGCGGFAVGGRQQLAVGQRVASG